MRHGEKKGRKLSTEGKARARFVPEYFEKHRPDGVGFPTHLVSMRPKHEKSSRRCIDTLVPMMRAIRTSLVVEFDREDMDDLATFVSRLPKNAVVLICWEHRWLVRIARRFGFPVMNWNMTPFSDDKDSKAFDILWKLDGISFESFATFSVRGHDIEIDEHPLKERVVMNPMTHRI